MVWGWLFPFTFFLFSFLFSLCSFLSPLPAHAEPSLTGQTGLLHMPDARVDPDGTWRTGYSVADPYSAIWISLTAMPRLEASLRYTEIEGVPGFSDTDRAESYGNFKDKSFDAKFLLFEEGRLWPAVAIGAQDIFGTEVFRATYLTAGKRIGDFDFTAGYGTDRIDGAFGGVRYRPEWMKGWALVAEYDATNFARDVGSDITGVDQRRKEIVAGVEYRKGWLGLQAGYGHDELSVNAYVAIPLQQKDFVPDINEPAPYTKITPRPRLEQWNADPEHRQRMLQALLRQDFKNVRIATEGTRIDVVLTNTRISDMSRAVGRAARTIVLLAPVETRDIRTTYTVNDLPFATYEFVDVQRLQRYFNGQIGRQELADYVDVRHAEPGSDDIAAEKSEVMAALDAERKSTFFDDTEGDLYSFRTEGSSLSRFKVAPRIGLYLNDPSGAFRYDVYLQAMYDYDFGNRLFFNSAARVTLAQDVGDVTQPSNSTLPHVRSDIAEYYDENGPKITKVMLNKYFHASERVYARASAGIYELMYGGAGGQVLYVPPSGRWAADLSVDWLRQRDFQGLFEFRDYETVTAIGALHYRMPYYGLTTTVRAGRFLARDNGVRFEVKRRFNSGFEIGAWYTFTDGNDITSPGSPSKPYYDKGIYGSMPLNAMLTRDTQATGGFSLAPWTRDVGQMVQSPGDLYDMLERPLANLKDQDGLVNLGDTNDDAHRPEPRNAIQESANWDAFQYYLSNTGAALISDEALIGAAISIGAVGLAYSVDDKVDDWARDHKDDRFNRHAGDLGRFATVGVLGASVFAALDRDDPRLSQTAVSSLQAAFIGLGVNLAGQYAVGRAKPELNLGKSDFEPGDRKRENSSFPSDLTTVAWAAVTPYAKEYGAPWLYGIAGLANLSRIAERKNWFSDTVAGSAIGYGIGSLMWSLNRERAKGDPTVSVGVDRVEVAWEFR
ncbi:MAG TPA: YjbH domain-containing protein [Burkholderiales bacterium]